MLIKGKDLNSYQKRLVFDAFIYRWTKDNPHRVRVYHCELCDIHNPYVNTETANGHTHPTIPLVTDEEWLKHYAFHFTKDGLKLSMKDNYAEWIG